MLALRQEALQMVNDMPDEWVLPILNYMRAYKEKQELAHKQQHSAYERLLSHAKPGVGSDDYKNDMAEMLVKKYESID